MRDISNLFGQTDSSSSLNKFYCLGFSFLTEMRSIKILYRKSGRDENSNCYYTFVLYKVEVKYAFCDFTTETRVFHLNSFHYKRNLFTEKIYFILCERKKLALFKINFLSM